MADRNVEPQVEPPVSGCAHAAREAGDHAAHRARLDEAQHVRRLLVGLAVDAQMLVAVEEVGNHGVRVLMRAPWMVACDVDTRIDRPANSSSPETFAQLGQLSAKRKSTSLRRASTWKVPFAGSGNGKSARSPLMRRRTRSEPPPRTAAFR